MNSCCPRSKPRPPEHPSPPLYVGDIFNGMYKLQDPETVLKVMAETYGKTHFNSPDGCFLSSICFFSSLLAAAGGLRVLTPWLG